MESAPFGSESSPSEKKSDSKEDKKKNASSRFAAAVPVARVEQSTEKPAQAPSAFEKFFADMAIKKQSEKAAPEAPKGEAKKTPEATTLPSQPESSGATTLPGQTEKAEPTEATKARTAETEDPKATEIKANKLPLQKIFGGEVVVDLGHEDERVVELREKEAETSRPTIWKQQAQQQHFARSHERPEPSESPEESETNEQEHAAAEADEMPESTTTTSEAVSEDGAPSAERAADTARSPETDTETKDTYAESVTPTSDETFNASQPAAERVIPHPEDIYQHQVYQQEHDASATRSFTGQGERVATKQDVEDAVYTATRAGQNRGVLAGALFFGGYEHFKHRRREKRMQKAAKNQNRKFQRESKDTNWKLREQAARQNQLERQVREQATATELLRKQQIAERQATAGERRSGWTERRFGTTKSAERRNTAKPERFKEKVEKLLPKRAQKTAEGIQAPEQLAIPPEHHLETSAWHTIEVDTKTGKAVEKPVFQYGHEYYRERAHESVPHDDTRNAAAGEVALVAAALAASSPDPSSAHTTDSTAGANGSAGPTGQVQSSQAKPSQSAAQQNAGPLWPWLVTFVVVVLLILWAVSG